MSEFQPQGECYRCKGLRLVTKYKGHYYCWMCLREHKDYNNVAHIEKGYKKFHKLVGKFKDAE
jgi:hypothetical protein